MDFVGMVVVDIFDYVDWLCGDQVVVSDLQVCVLYW